MTMSWLQRPGECKHHQYHHRRENVQHSHAPGVCWAEGAVPIPAILAGSIHCCCWGFGGCSCSWTCCCCCWCWCWGCCCCCCCCCWGCCWCGGGGRAPPWKGFGVLVWWPSDPSCVPWCWNDTWVGSQFAKWFRASVVVEVEWANCIMPPWGLAPEGSIPPGAGACCCCAGGAGPGSAAAMTWAVCCIVCCIAAGFIAAAIWGIWNAWGTAPCIIARPAGSIVVAAAGAVAWPCAAWTRGTISMRKSYTSLSPTAACRSCLCRVRRLFRSVCCHARKDRSFISSSQALLINIGASPDIMNLILGLSWASSATPPAALSLRIRSFSSSCIIISSLFMIFFTRARGRACIFQFSVPTHAEVANILVGERHSSRIQNSPRTIHCTNELAYQDLCQLCPALPHSTCYWDPHQRPWCRSRVNLPELRPLTYLLLDLSEDQTTHFLLKSLLVLKVSRAANHRPHIKRMPVNPSGCQELSINAENDGGGRKRGSSWETSVVCPRSIKIDCCSTFVKPTVRFPVSAVETLLGVAN